MASQQPAIPPPPPGTTAKTRKRPPKPKKSKKSKSAQIETTTSSNKRQVLRPTEIVTPSETPEREQDANQIIDTSDEDEYDNVDLPDEEDGEGIELSEGDEDGSEDDEEYDEDEDDDDDEDIESVYLSDSEPEDTASKAVVRSPAQAVRSTTSSRHPASASRSSEKNLSQPQHTFVETRTQSSQWVVAQQQPSRGVTVTRGASTSRQQTIRQQFQTPNATTSPQERRVSNGNGLRLNMSFNLDVNFSGLVTGRNLSLAGGSLSYAWARDRRS